MIRTLDLRSRALTKAGYQRELPRVKGAASGDTQEVKTISLDCDGDAILLRVHQVGAPCHTGDATCFHRAIALKA